MQNHILEKSFSKFFPLQREKSNVPEEHTSPILYKTAHSQTTLGISLGNRLLGIAVCNSSELLYFKLKDFKGRWCIQKQHAIIKYIEEIFKEYNVTNIICKHASNLKYRENALATQLQKLFPTITILTSLDIKKMYRNISIMINTLTGIFPELTLYKNRYHRVSRNSYKKLFEAIAISLHSQNNNTHHHEYIL